MINLSEKDTFVEFSSLKEKLDKLREWELIGIRDYKKLISGDVVKIKPIIYKGIFAKGKINCDVIGYITQRTNYGVYETAVIVIYGETNKINPAYLKQMQSKNFSLNNSKEE